MSEVVVLENSLDEQWHVHFRAMAAQREVLDAFLGEAYPGRGFEVAQDELRIWRAAATWPAQDYVEVHFALSPSELARWRLVAWHVPAGQRVSAAMVDAGAAFAMATGLEPQYAFIRAIPVQTSEGVDVRGIMLVQADWVPSGFLAVGRGGMMELKG